jgi:hypothetical protein
MWFFQESETREDSYRAAPGQTDDALMAWMIAQVLNDDEAYGQVVEADQREQAGTPARPGFVDPATHLTEEEASMAVVEDAVEGWRY